MDLTVTLDNEALIGIASFTVAFIGGILALVRSLYEKRIADKDNQIESYKNQLDQWHADLNAKDATIKTLHDKIEELARSR